MYTPKTPRTLEEFQQVYDKENRALNGHLCADLLTLLVTIHYEADPVEKLILSNDVNQLIEWIREDYVEHCTKVLIENVAILDPMQCQPVKWLEAVLDGWPKYVLEKVNCYLERGIFYDLFSSNKRPLFVSSYELASNARRYRDDEKLEITSLRKQRDAMDNSILRHDQQLWTLKRENERLKNERETIEREKERLQNELETLEHKMTLLQAESEVKATVLKQTDKAPESTSQAPDKTKEKPPKLSKTPNAFHPELSAKAKLLYERLLILTSFGKKGCVYTNHTAQKELHFKPRSTDRYFKELRDAKLLTTTNTSCHPNAHSINVRMVEINVEAMPPKRAANRAAK